MKDDAQVHFQEIRLEIDIAVEGFCLGFLPIELLLLQVAAFQYRETDLYSQAVGEEHAHARIKAECKLVDVVISPFFSAL